MLALSEDSYNARIEGILRSIGSGVRMLDDLYDEVNFANGENADEEARLEELAFRLDRAVRNLTVTWENVNELLDPEGAFDDYSIPV